MNPPQETRGVPLLGGADPLAARQEARVARRQQQHLQLQVHHLRRNRAHLQGMLHLRSATLRSSMYTCHFKNGPLLSDRITWCASPPSSRSPSAAWAGSPPSTRSTASFTSSTPTPVNVCMLKHWIHKLCMVNMGYALGEHFKMLLSFFDTTFSRPLQTFLIIPLQLPRSTPTRTSKRPSTA